MSRLVRNCIIAGAAALAFAAFRIVWKPLLPLDLHPAAALPACTAVDGRLAIAVPGNAFIAFLGTFQDELFAYLMFDYYRSRPELSAAEVYLTYRERGSQPEYRISASVPGDLFAATSLLGSLVQKGIVPKIAFGWAPDKALRGYRAQTEFFHNAYNLPVHTALDKIPRERLTGYVRRFLRFKSTTDRRVRRALVASLEPLSSEEAGTLAADIIAVADFYSLPLDFFLGIGAMENNYLNVAGDIGHTTWKRRAQPGDVILKRRRGRVLVLNESSGIWQITRETLRFAHKLYLEDKTRDYSKLPERLRPSKKLDLDNVKPEVLTTYAGLLLRDLLDRFHGNIPEAVGAYNGGIHNPNMRYSEGVHQVAEYARQVLERAAALNGAPAIEKEFITR